MKKGDKVVERQKVGRNIMSVVDEPSSVNEPPERDIGPTTSTNVILRDLNQMAHDYTRTQMGTEISRMRQLENIYTLTDNPAVELTLNEVNEYKGQIREKKKILDQVVTARTKIFQSGKRNEQLALTYGGGGGGDCLINLTNQNFDQKLLDMERRIVEAKQCLHSRGTDSNLQEALHNYHEVFKQSMESFENIAKNRRKTTKTKVDSLRQFIEDTEKTMLPEGKGDSLVSEAITELRRLNKYNNSSPNDLPFVPSLPYNFEEDLAQLSVSYNDVLDDIGIERELVRIPVTQFLNSALELKPAKSIMKKITDNEAKGSKKSGLKKTKKKVKF